MEKEKVNDEKPDPQNSLDFSEHFNQLELLETHGHLIPTGTQSLWIGNSDDDEEQDEKTEDLAYDSINGIRGVSCALEEHRCSRIRTHLHVSYPVSSTATALQSVLLEKRVTWWLLPSTFFPFLNKFMYM